MDTAPPSEHRWLDTLVGEWTSEAGAIMEPGKPPARFEETESVRSVGGLWTVAEAQCEMPGGGGGTTLMMLGYDPQRKRFELESDDHRVLTSHVQGDDGAWQVFMTANYRRTR